MSPFSARTNWIINIRCTVNNAILPNIRFYAVSCDGCYVGFGLEGSTSAWPEAWQLSNPYGGELVRREQ
jgi:hypothetical protein